MTRRWLVMAVLTLGLSGGVAEAQQRPSRGVPAAPSTPAAPPPDVPQPFEPELLSLAETLGVLAYMGALCNEPDRAEWPKRMGQLLDAEGALPGPRQRLAGAYNRGFLGHQPTHRACTDAGRQVIQRSVAKGRQLTRQLASRYSS